MRSHAEHGGEKTETGFMSVQSWQTTSSGMAVTYYEPGSVNHQPFHPASF